MKIQNIIYDIIKTTNEKHLKDIEIVNDTKLQLEFNDKKVYCRPSCSFEQKNTLTTKGFSGDITLSFIGNVDIIEDIIDNLMRYGEEHKLIDNADYRIIIYDDFSYNLMLDVYSISFKVSVSPLVKKSTVK